jgi:hypothetical protein
MYVHVYIVRKSNVAELRHFGTGSVTQQKNGAPTGPPTHVYDNGHYISGHYIKAHLRQCMLIATHL